MNKILLNMAKCNLCGDILESTYRHDYKECKCKSLIVDGGKDYIRRGFINKNDFTELSLIYEEE